MSARTLLLSAIVFATAIAPLARGQDERAAAEEFSGPNGAERLLPARPELTVSRPQGADPVFTLRGRDIAAAEFLALLAKDGDLAIQVDAAAVSPLKTTIVSADLHERRADFIVDLLAAAAGCDVARELHGFRIVGPPGPDAPIERPLVRDAAYRFYEQAFTRQKDATVAAQALRGMAEIDRRGGDFASAYAAYDSLLTRFPSSPAAKGTEILLADCFAAVGDRTRALNLLKSFLDHCTDNDEIEAVLTRIMRLLTAEHRLREIEDLREAFLKITPLGPEAVSALADAAASVLDAGDAPAAVLMLQELWRADPVAHAPLGPVLALALVATGDQAASERVVERSVIESPEVLEQPAALAACAELARRTGNLPAALLFAERALVVENAGPAARLRANLLLADLWQDLGLDKRARHHLYEAEQLSTPEAAAKLALRSAQLALDAGEPEHARLLFQDALKYPAAHGPAELGVARALLASNEPARARDVLRELLDAGELPSAIVNGAIDVGTECLIRLNASDKARALLRGDVAALDADPAPSGAPDSAHGPQAPHAKDAP